MLWVRNVHDRLTKLAPFLSYDGDPYPVVVDGRVQWVVDAYTTTSRYPYAQRIGNDVQLTSDSGLDRDSNYVRNSVKAVVDAYDGSVTFYVSDDEDPIIKAWESAFGDLFTPRRPDAGGAARAPALPRGPVPGADRPVLQVPARARPRSSSARALVGRPGAGHRSPRDRRPATTRHDHAADDQQTPADLASESSTSRFIPYYTMFAHRPARAGRVRAAASVRAVLARPTSAPSCRRT